MTDPELPGAAPQTSSAVAAHVVQALKSGGNIGSLRPFLQEGILSPEQRNIIEFLELLEDLDEVMVPDTDTESMPDQQSSGAGELQTLRDEVVVLREVNDTAAAALGACRMCWGGDAFCPACDGQGRPGANLPDLRFYNELVKPAVERMTARRGAATESVRFAQEEAKR